MKINLFFTSHTQILECVPRLAWVLLHFFYERHCLSFRGSLRVFFLVHELDMVLHHSYRVVLTVRSNDAKAAGVFSRQFLSQNIASS
jgi:hypothetical protein